MDNLKMFGRYGIAIVVGYLVGTGKLTPEAGDTMSKALIDLGGLLIAALPAIYAAMKVNNAPKT